MRRGICICAYAPLVLGGIELRSNAREKSAAAGRVPSWVLPWQRATFLTYLAWIATWLLLALEDN